MEMNTGYRPPPPRTTYSLRFREAERRLIETAALSAGVRLSEYVRNAALTKAREELSR